MTNFAFLIFVYHFERIILDKKKYFWVNYEKRKILSNYQEKCKILMKY